MPRDVPTAIKRRIVIGHGLYAFGALLCLVNTYLSIVIAALRTRVLFQNADVGARFFGGQASSHSTPLIAQMSPPCGLKRSNSTHFPSGDHTG
jgi:hypothetical protein